MQSKYLAVSLFALALLSGCGDRPVRERGWIGGTYRTFPARTERLFLGTPDVRVGLPAPLAGGRSGAVLVEAVYDETPADRAGLRPGDIVLRVGDEPVETSEDFLARVDAAVPEEPLTLHISRFGTALVLEVPVATERLQDRYLLVFGLASPFHCDLFPNRDFNVFGLLGWQLSDPRLELHSPAVRAERMGRPLPPAPKGSEGGRHVGTAWSFRLGFLSLSHSPKVLSQG